MLLEQVVFFVFAGIAVIAASMVVMLNHPVRCVLSLVLTFLACAGLWLLAYAEFLALILVLVYVGAVMTLFLFVIMMLDVETVALRSHFVRYLPFGLAIVALLLALMVVVISPENFAFAHLQQAIAYDATYSNTQALGAILYTDYGYAFELAAILLLVSIVAAITLVHRKPHHSKTQDPLEQMMVDPTTRIKLVDPKLTESLHERK